MVKAATETTTLDTHSRRGICLRVCIYKQYTHFGDGKGSSQIYGGRSFTDPTLLIGYRDGLRHSSISLSLCSQVRRKLTQTCCCAPYFFTF
jgi:hypothetical protein